MILPFDYHGVTLNAGNLKRQFDEVRDFYLRLPNDDLLRGYRLRAGLPAPGADLGGCYLTHNTFGQILSGLARMYAATGDSACKEKAEALLRGWAECMAPDGFFFIVPEPELPAYYYDKMVGGLVDLHLYCGNKAALNYLSVITDWAVKHISRARPYASPLGKDGGEWYTLSENLYRAYLATGDAKYRDFAEVWEYREFWDYFASKGNIFEHAGLYRPAGLDCGVYHAYSHVNSFNSLAAAYLVKGHEGDLESLKNAYDFLWENELWATGGYGPDEALLPREKLAGMLDKTTNHFETQCGTWAAFKMCKYLMRFTGDAKYGDWIELLILNGIGASIPMDPDGGVFYYSEYNLGGSAKKNVNPWACCSGTRIQAVADFNDLIYFKDEDTLYLNIFAPATVEWAHRNGAVTIVQRTDFPESPRTELVIAVAKPMEFGIKVRAPGWLAGKMTASVNGQAIPVTIDSRHWAGFRRTWRNGDTLTIDLPMKFSLSRIEPDKPYPFAIMYGPVTMAVGGQGKNPAGKFVLADPAQSLVPVEGQPLHYRLAADPSILVRPFYAFKKGEPYVVYLDPRQSHANA